MYIGNNEKSPLVFPIGYKRNRVVSLSTHDIIVHMDDDDYYPPESVLARVRCLLLYNDTRCVGCEYVRTFNLFTEQTLEAHETVHTNLSESTLTYHKSFWEERHFEPMSSQGEGIAFIENRLNECLSIPSVFVITQFDHLQNTCKRYSTTSPMNNTYTCFLDSLDNNTRLFITELRDRIALHLPDTRRMIEFIKTCGTRAKASALLSTLPNNLQRHPIAIDLRRKHIQNKKHYDIVFYCGSGSLMSFTNVWDDTQCSNIGGSEEAVLNLAHAFVTFGRNVHVFNERDDVIRNKKGVTFEPWYTFCPLNKCNTVIVWRDPSNLELSFNAKCVLFDVHDFLPSVWFKSTYRVDVILLKSMFQYTIVPSELHYKCKCIPNGVHCTTLKTSRTNTILCTSSPERCWHSLFRLAKDLCVDFPSFRVVHAYSLDNVRQSVYWNTLKQYIEQSFGNVDILGNVPLNKIDELYQTSSVFVYPTTFPEIDCVSLTKAITNGCRCIHTSAGAMREKETYGTTCTPSRTLTSTNTDFQLNDEEYNDFRNAVYETLHSLTRSSSPNTEKARNTFAVMTVARLWNDCIKKVKKKTF